MVADLIEPPPVNVRRKCVAPLLATVGGEMGATASRAVRCGAEPGTDSVPGSGSTFGFALPLGSTGAG